MSFLINSPYNESRFTTKFCIGNSTRIQNNHNPATHNEPSLATDIVDPVGPQSPGGLHVVRPSAAPPPVAQPAVRVSS